MCSTAHAWRIPAVTICKGAIQFKRGRELFEPFETCRAEQRTVLLDQR
jgi:hypothetical protein